MAMFSEIKIAWKRLSELMGLRFVGENTTVPSGKDFHVPQEQWEALQRRLIRFHDGEDGPKETICIHELTAIWDNPIEPEIDIHWDIYDPTAVAATA